MSGPLQNHVNRMLRVRYLNNYLQNKFVNELVQIGDLRNFWVPTSNNYNGDVTNIQ